MRILIVAHGHPDFVKGGGELAAYKLFAEMVRNGQDAYFLAAHHHDKISHAGTSFSMLRDREILFMSRMSDFFFFHAHDKTVVWRDFAQLMDTIRPDVIHFHHFIHLGIQFLREAACYKRERNPAAQVVYTFHEFVPICANAGQMIMRRSDELCTEASPARCSACLGDRSPEDVFLRETLIRSSLATADKFISPSKFLIERYRNWGFDSHIEVIENGQEPVDPVPPRALKKGKRRCRFAYLGQINRYKGLQVLLEALRYIPEDDLEEVEVHIYGSGLEDQPSDMQERIGQLCTQFERNVTLHGRYLQQQLPAIMASIDTVVVPSIWWENSPLVIQEAFKYGRPVLCADIGGMAEKVRHDVDGRHFLVRSPTSLAEQMLIMADPAYWSKLQSQTARPVTLEHSFRQHMEFYGRGEQSLPGRSEPIYAGSRAPRSGEAASTQPPMRT